MSSLSRIIRGGQFPARVQRPFDVPVQPVGLPHREENASRQKPKQETPQEMLRQAQQEAQKTLENARMQSKAILMEAQTQAGLLQQQAYQKGHQKGYEEGMEAGRRAGEEKLKEKLHLVYQLAHEAAECKERIISGGESDVVELVIDVAKKIIGEEIILNRKVITQVAAAAIEQVRPGDPLTIRVNPQDVETLMEYWDKALGENPGERHWQIVADRRVRPGGCIVDTESGTVDAQIDTQLVRIRNAFESLHGGREASPQ